MAIVLDQDRALDIDDRPGLPFSFTGKASEYFGIWIVNILLSIVTLGIYSAWAKVRNKRYFYGNTKLKGSSFNYLASPIQILKGRLIMFAFFVAYTFCSTFFPILAWVFIAAMIVLTPWAVVRALTFNAQQSSYRNVRFGFDGQIAEAAKLYVLLPVLSLLTLGGLWPYMTYRTNRFLAANSRYGQKKFSFEGKAGAYYKYYGVAVALGLMGMVVYGWAFVSGASEADVDPHAIDWSLFLEFGPLTYVSIGIAIVLGLVAYSYLTTRLQNYYFNNTKLDEHQLFLDLSLWRVLWIRLSNLLVIAFSFGLMIPWAKIRMTRYQIECMSLIPHGDLDTLVSEQQENIGAYGDEFGDGMDLDLGLGV